MSRHVRRVGMIDRSEQAAVTLGLRASMSILRSCVMRCRYDGIGRRRRLRHRKRGPARVRSVAAVSHRCDAADAMAVVAAGQRRHARTRLAVAIVVVSRRRHGIMAPGAIVAVEPMRHRIRGAAPQRRGQQCIRKVLVAHRSQEAFDRERADRRAAAVRRRGIRTAVHHRMRDLDAGRPAVREYTAGLAFEHRQQPRASAWSSCGQMQRRRQLAFEMFEHAISSASLGAAHDDRRRAEHFVRDLGMLEQDRWQRSRTAQRGRNACLALRRRARCD